MVESKVLSNWKIFGFLCLAQLKAMAIFCFLSALLVGLIQYSDKLSDFTYVDVISFIATGFISIWIPIIFSYFITFPLLIAALFISKLLIKKNRYSWWHWIGSALICGLIYVSLLGFIIGLQTDGNLSGTISLVHFIFSILSPLVGLFMWLQLKKYNKSNQNLT